MFGAQNIKTSQGWQGAIWTNEQLVKFGVVHP
jgi:hypothetical protein